MGIFLNHCFRLTFLLLLAIYLLLLAHIPILIFSATPTIPLGIWLAAVAAVFLNATWLAYAFSRARLVSLIILTAAVHLAVFTIPGVRMAFDIDRCLDFGGVWENDTCHTAATPAEKPE